MADLGNAPLPAVAGGWCWNYDDPAPRGGKILLLTEGRVAVIGIWSNDGGFVAWAPLPKRDKRREATPALAPPSSR